MQKFQFQYVDNDSYCISSYEGDEAEVKVPAEYNRKPISILGDQLFQGHAEITSVILPPSLTDIGTLCFDGCSQLSTVVLPDSIENLWQYAFARSGIREIHIPDRMRSIAPYTFMECDELQCVTGGAGLKNIRVRAFQNCRKLESVEIVPGVTVSEGAFEGCPRMEKNT